MRYYIKNFNSIGDFYRYICNTPFNNTFSNSNDRKSNEVSKLKDEFTMTHTFDEAVNLLKNGWDVKAEELTQRLKVTSKNIVPVKTRKDVLSVSGYQPVIALYLAGIPQNMIDKRMVIQKQKVIEITKNISYSWRFGVNEIMEESIKCLMIVKKLEAQGYRVKLNIALGEFGRKTGNERMILCKVCIKQPNDRLNVSKVAFPLVHPAMLRRLMYRYIEVCPDVTQDYKFGYGVPVSAWWLKDALPKDIIIDKTINADINEVKELESLDQVIATIGK